MRVLRDLYPKDGDHAATATSDTAAVEREPLAFRLVRKIPALRHLTGRFIGRGIRPEHPRAAPAAMSSSLG